MEKEFDDSVTESEEEEDDYDTDKEFDEATDIVIDIFL